jgi:hypothetical protein
VFVSFVLRLVTEALDDLRIVGRIEAVETGEAVPIRSAEDLLRFLYAHGDHAAEHVHGGVQAQERGER